jgi:integrase
MGNSGRPNEEAESASGATSPAIRSVARCMSENTLNAALRRMGFKNEDMTSHGFRASASSILNESGLWNADAIERQLAHVDGDSVRRAYARAEFWDERVQMMAWWADKCEAWRHRPPAQCRGARRRSLTIVAIRRICRNSI